MRTRIYISGPISKGNRNHHLFQSLEAEERLLLEGYAVFNPMPSMQRPFNDKLQHGEWLEHDFSWVAVSAAVLRLPGESIGGDMETAYAAELGIPVFHDIEQLILEVPSYAC